MKTDRNETASIKHYNMEEASVSGFCAFCKKNIPLVLAVTIALFFAYGIRLFWHSIGFDTTEFMNDESKLFIKLVAWRRFGEALLTQLLYIKGFNPFTAFYIAFCLIWFFTISWCYIIAIFSRDTGRNNKLIPFALVFMTMPVWSAHFHFTMMAAEIAIINSLCPYVIYLLYKGFLDGEKGKIACASILLVFMTAVYQAIVPLFCCGVFACFVLLQEHTDYEARVYRSLCLKLFLTLLAAMAVYYVIANVIIPFVFHIDLDYLHDTLILWGKKPLRIIILSILTFCYLITIGDIPLVHNIVIPIIAAHAQTGNQLANDVANLSKVYGNLLLLPCIALYLVQMAGIMRKKIPARRRLLYMLAGIGVPLSIILMAIFLGGIPGIRTLYVLPLALAFMFFFLIRTYKKKVAAVVMCIAIVTAFYQAETSAQIFYSDKMGYDEDVHIAYELYHLVAQVQPDDEKLPVAFIGKYQRASRSQPWFLPGEIVTYSYFGYTEAINGFAFLRNLGLYLDRANEEQVAQARKEAELMPSYPDPDCVRRMDGFIVVKVSNILDEYE